MMILGDACIILQGASRRVGGPATVLTMRDLMHATSARQARRMPADQGELAHRIARALPRDGTVEPQPGLHFRRYSRPTATVLMIITYA
jgi:hypothetical protein